MVRASGGAAGRFVRFFVRRDHQMWQLVDEMSGLRTYAI